MKAESSSSHVRELGNSGIKEPTTGTPVMCGPGVHVAFARANGLVHSLGCRVAQLGRRRDAVDPVGLVTVAPSDRDGSEPATPRESSSPVYQEMVTARARPTTAVPASVCS